MYYLIAFAKTGLAFIALWAISRRLTKHMVRRVTVFDFISSIVLGTLTGATITHNQSPPVILASAAFWGSLALFFNWLDLQGRGIQSFLNGTPVVLIENGKIMEKNLRKEQLTLQHLESMLRISGYFSIDEIEICMLETTGQISVRPKSQKRPVQTADLGLPTTYEALSTQLIHDGRPLRKELQGIGLTEAWLAAELAKQGISQPDEVFAAWLTSDGRLVVDRYDDRN